MQGLSQLFDLAKTRWQRPFLFGCCALVTFNFLVVLVNARHLRPSADDYCTGFIAQYGLFGAPLHMWSTWSGYFFTMFLENIVNGLPLLYFPWSLSSAIPFLMSAIGMGVVTYILIPHHDRNIRALLFLLPLMCLLWWSYVWFPVAFLRSEANLANGLTHWQTLTGGYMLTTEILISLWALLWEKSKKSSLFWVMGILFALLGLLFGLTSEPINLAAISAIGLYFFCWPFVNKVHKISKARIYLLIFGVLVLIGFAMAHLSPGNLARTALIKPDFSFSIERIYYLASWTFPYGVMQWLRSYYGFQGIIVFVIIISLHVLSGKTLCAALQGDYLKRGMQLSGFGLLLFLVARFGEAFSYEGYWHIVSGLVLTVLSIYFFAKYGASILVTSYPNISKVFFALLLSASLSMAIFSNAKMVKSIQSRGVLWSQGKAPLSGVVDIETEWVNHCWSNLLLLRGQKNQILR